MAVVASVFPLVTPGKARGAGAGALDLGFGTSGIVRTDFGGRETLNAIAVQPDGKIVTAGSTDANGETDFALARYNPDGTLDSTFGTGGKVVTDIGDSDVVKALVLQPDGKIVVAGNVTGPTYLGGSAWAIVRYLPAGTLDLEFAGTGLVITDFAGVSKGSDSVSALLIQPDGKLLGAGAAHGMYSADTDSAFARYNADGSPDMSFGLLGRAVIDSGYVDEITSMGLRGDGRILAGGHDGVGLVDNAMAEVEDTVEGTRIRQHNPYYVTRLMPHGSVDTDFGNQGQIRTDGGADAMSVQPDGAFMTASGGSSFNLESFRPEGTRDTSFGTGGKVATAFDPGAAAKALVRRDGKLLAAGGPAQSCPTCGAIALARYNADDGSIDTTFGSGGKVTTEIGAGTGGRALAIDADGNPVAGATGKPGGGGTSDFVVARYLTRSDSPGPSVVSISPTIGATAGGTEVVITGSGFTGLTSVNFGDIAVKPPFVRIDSDTRVTATAPGRAGGTVTVTVTTPLGTSTDRPRFTFADEVGRWRATSPLLQARLGHSATVLSDGRALIVGGDSGGTGASSSELYDPDAGQWITSGNLSTARAGHTATLLRDGRVLVTGGTGPVSTDVAGGRVAVNGAEVWDPGTRTWSRVASMATPRHGQVATLLPDGRVLVAGGSSSVLITSVALASAELFDPATGTWAQAQPMTTARMAHTATALGDGRVLVAGGVSGNNCRDAATCVNPPLATAEIYEPDTASWASANPMTASRMVHSATLLADGDVLVVGGYGSTTPGDSGRTPLATSEVYDSSTGAWTATSNPMNRGGPNVAVRLPTGQVLVADTWSGDCSSPHLTSMLYDPVLRQWNTARSMATARACPSLSLLPSTGEALVTGGRDNLNHATLASAELYGLTAVPDVPRVVALEPFSAPTNGPRARVSISGRGLLGATSVMFGSASANVVFNSGDRLVVDAPVQAQGTVDVVVRTEEGVSAPASRARFTYGEGAWRPGTPIPEPRFLHTATLLDPPPCHGQRPSGYAGYPCGQVLVAGGSANIVPDARTPARDSAARYDPETGRWHMVEAMPGGPRYDFSATLLRDGRVMVTGGRTADSHVPGLKTALVFDPRTGHWESTANTMTDGRLSHTATLLPDGKVLVAGGAASEPPDRPPLASTELFDPATNSWSPGQPMLTARGLHTATALPDGGVLVAGGLGSVPMECDRTRMDDLCRREVTLRSAEMYDPATGRWVGVGDLAVGRYAHTATLLGQRPCGHDCGKVLAAGGFANGILTDGMPSVEMFEPATATWAPAANLGTSRGGHQATLLPNGTVLVEGRSYPFPNAPPSDGNQTTSAEVYDPVTSAWRTTTAMGVPRGIHTATLLDGPACRGIPVGPWCGSVLSWAAPHEGTLPPRSRAPRQSTAWSSTPRHPPLARWCPALCRPPAAVQSRYTEQAWPACRRCP